jgi:hypothetical protein
MKEKGPAVEAGPVTRKERASMSDQIVFQEPPTDRRSALNYPKIADALRARPGEWALIATSIGASEIAQRIKRGSARGFAAGEFETTTRKTADGGVGRDVYVRYVGGDAR